MINVALIDGNKSNSIREQFTTAKCSGWVREVHPGSMALTKRISHLLGPMGPWPLPPGIQNLLRQALTQDCPTGSRPVRHDGATANGPRAHSLHLQRLGQLGCQQGTRKLTDNHPRRQPRLTCRQLSVAVANGLKIVETSSKTGWKPRKLTSEFVHAIAVCFRWRLRTAKIAWN